MVSNNSLSCHDKGFTLIELLLVLSLIGLVLGIGYNAFYGTFVSWSHNESINSYIASTNTTLTMLSREIRSAESPAASEKSVQSLDSGKQLVIYQYNLNATGDPWEKICYRYQESVLQRTVLKAATGSEVAVLSFPDDGADWKDQLPGVPTSSQENSFQVDPNTGKVDIALVISDVDRPTNKRFADYSVSSSYYPRNKAPGSLYSEEIEEEEESPEIPIYRLELLTPHGYFSPLTLDLNQSSQVQVRFWPANTTDKTVTSTTTEYVTVTQDANNPSSVTITAIKETPTTWFFGTIYWPQEVVLSSHGKTVSFYVIVK
jgi:prepilin-type N-terminal cleavage/methylation domain-containing protein